MTFHIDGSYFNDQRYLAKGYTVTAIYDRVIKDNWILNTQEILNLNHDQAEMYVEILNDDNAHYLSAVLDYCFFR